MIQCLVKLADEGWDGTLNIGAKDELACSYVRSCRRSAGLLLLRLCMVNALEAV